MADQFIQRCLLSELVESPTNPRKRRDAKADEELRNSILEVGVIEPIVIRTAPATGDEPRFEIVCGSRRYRASKDGGLDTIPAILKVLTDGEALEIQFVENLQRKDIEPLDEADGYAQMLAAGYTVSQVALKLGKTERYVAQRLSLTKLIPRLRELLERDLLTLGVAVEAARHTAQDQADFVTHFGFDEETERLVEARYFPEAPPHLEDVRLFFLRKVANLAHAQWDLSDALLLPAAGACLTCPKRTGNAGVLFEDLADSCLDPKCFEAKRAAHLDAQRIALTEKTDTFVQLTTGSLGKKGELTRVGDVNFVAPGQKRCGETKAAVIVDGPATGKTLDVCTTEDCPIHRVTLTNYGTAGEDLDAQAEEWAKRDTGNASKWREEEKKRKAAQAAKTKKARSEAAVRAKELVTILASDRLGSILMNKAVTRMTAEALIKALQWGIAAGACAALGIKLGEATSDEDARGELTKALNKGIDQGNEGAVNRVLLAVLLAPEACISEYATSTPPAPRLARIKVMLADAAVKREKASKVKPRAAKAAPVDIEDGPCKCASFDPSDDMDEGVCTCGHHEDEHDTAGTLQACLVGHADDIEAPKPKGKAGECTAFLQAFTRNGKKIELCGTCNKTKAEHANKCPQFTRAAGSPLCTACGRGKADHVKPSKAAEPEACKCPSFRANATASTRCTCKHAQSEHAHGAGYCTVGHPPIAAKPPKAKRASVEATS